MISIHIGYYRLFETKVFTNSSYECAAWYKKIEVKPGEYPIYLVDNKWICASLPGTVVASDFTSHFGGQRIGSKINEDVGKAATYSIQAYAYDIARVILENKPQVENWILFKDVVEPIWHTFTYKKNESTIPQLKLLNDKLPQVLPIDVTLASCNSGGNYKIPARTPCRIETYPNNKKEEELLIYFPLELHKRIHPFGKGVSFTVGKTDPSAVIISKYYTDYQLGSATYLQRIVNTEYLELEKLMPSTV